MSEETKNTSTLFHPMIYQPDLLETVSIEAHHYRMFPKRSFHYKEFYGYYRDGFGLVLCWLNPLPQDLPYEEPIRKKRKYSEEDINKWLFNILTDEQKLQYKKIMKRYDCNCIEWQCTGDCLSFLKKDELL